MELVEHLIRYKSLRDPHPTVIVPLGDIQWTGDPGDVAIRTLQERIERGMAENAWFIGMGDYIDYCSPRNREELRAARLYDNARSVIDRSAKALVDDLYEKILKPTRGRWIGLLEGHHFHTLESGITTDQYLCDKLETKHLGTCAYIGLRFMMPGRYSGTVNIWCHHGQGGGQTPAAPLNKLNQLLPDWEADIFLIGHMTKQATAPINRVYPVWPRFGPPRLLHETKFLVGTGGFGKGYIERSKQGQVPRGTYVERGMMRPAVLGCPMIRIIPRILDVPMPNKTRAKDFCPIIKVELGG